MEIFSANSKENTSLLEAGQKNHLFELMRDFIMKDELKSKMNNAQLQILSDLVKKTDSNFAGSTTNIKKINRDDMRNHWVNYKERWTPEHDVFKLKETICFLSQPSLLLKRNVSKEWYIRYDPNYIEAASLEGKSQGANLKSAALKRAFDAGNCSNDSQPPSKETRTESFNENSSVESIRTVFPSVDERTNIANKLTGNTEFRAMATKPDMLPHVVMTGIEAWSNVFEDRWMQRESAKAKQDEAWKSKIQKSLSELDRVDRRADEMEDAVDDVVAQSISHATRISQLDAGLKEVTKRVTSLTDQVSRMQSMGTRPKETRINLLYQKWLDAKRMDVEQKKKMTSGPFKITALSKDYIVSYDLEENSSSAATLNINLIKALIGHDFKVIQSLENNGSRVRNEDGSPRISAICTLVSLQSTDRYVPKNSLRSKAMETILDSKSRKYAGKIIVSYINNTLSNHEFIYQNWKDEGRILNYGYDKSGMDLISIKNPENDSVTHFKIAAPSIIVELCDHDINFTTFSKLTDYTRFFVGDGEILQIPSKQSRQLAERRERNRVRFGGNRTQPRNNLWGSASRINPYAEQQPFSSGWRDDHMGMPSGHNRYDEVD